MTTPTARPPAVERNGSAPRPRAASPLRTGWAAAPSGRGPAPGGGGGAPPPAGGAAAPGGRPPRELLTWLRVQADNSHRHVAALRPFTREEFGIGPEAPTEGHVQGANELMRLLT